MNQCDRSFGLSREQLCSPQNQQHLDACEVCGSLVRALEEARAITPYQLSARRDAALQQALFASKPHPRSFFEGWPRYGVLLAAASVALLWWSTITPAPPTIEIASSQPSPNTKWVTLAPKGDATFSQQSTPTEELLLLQQGTLELHVDAKNPSQRMKIHSQTGEALIAVQAHLVVTANYSFEEISLQSGVAELISPLGEKILLRAGERWNPPKVTKPPKKNPEKTKRPTQIEPQEPPKEVVVEVSPPPEEFAFQRGVEALREGDFLVAAVAFEQSEKAPTLAQESLFFRATALYKAGELSLAREAMLSFLQQAPKAHLEEAHLTLGLIYLKERSFEEAESHLTSVLESTASLPRVKESALRGLSQLKTARQ